MTNASDGMFDALTDAELGYLRERMFRALHSSADMAEAVNRYAQNLTPAEWAIVSGVFHDAGRLHGELCAVQATRGRA